MLHTNRVIITEGRYDKIKLSNVTDALILTTEGFGVFNDREKQKFIKKTAAEKGLIIITDSDGAGFKIRNFIKNIACNGDIIHIYIPDVFGKEKRKIQASKEGKLGVEGIDNNILTEALLKSGAFEECSESITGEITNADLYEAGFTGCSGAKDNRKKLLLALGLPERLTGASFLSVINSFMTYSQFKEYISTHGN